MWKYISATNVNQKWMLRSPLFSLSATTRSCFSPHPVHSPTYTHPCVIVSTFNSGAKLVNESRQQETNLCPHSGRHVTSATRNCTCASRTLPVMADGSHHGAVWTLVKKNYSKTETCDVCVGHKRLPCVCETGHCTKRSAREEGAKQPLK